MAILGIDEVGRGPLAGPLVVGAVILPEKRSKWVEELRDSKQIKPRRRKELAWTINKYAEAVGLGWVESDEIDRMGMMEALRLATRRAVEEVQAQKKAFSEIVIDGNINFLEGTRLAPYTTTVIRGDDLIREVSAASIVAKVARDDYMIELGEKYPEYGFEQHMGYGTEMHRMRMREFGLCPEHRRLVKLVYEIAKREGEDLSQVWTKEKQKNTTEIGKKAERAVAEYLKEHGHMIIAQNFKNKYCEIDLVSVDVMTGKIFFTEVKYRKDDGRGGGLEAVDKTKQEQMGFAAEMFLKKNRKFKEYDPILTVADVAGEDFVVRDWVPVI
ncbi:ribonuclease HII [Candidatus Saccharibacteria bacterium]|nr:ribonuclease HII [Candidatus Saccharibacteria bacterium]